MLFDKILNYLNLDNWKNGNYINTSHSEYSDVEKHLYTIESFYQVNTCDYICFQHRKPSTEEIQEFAKVNILSCFTNARSIDNFSDLHLAQLGITNFNKFFSALQQADYIRIATPLEILNTYTLKHLKILADSLGINKTGNKAELAQRLFNYLTPEEMKRIQKTESDLFILTGKGKAFLSNQEDYVLLCKNRKYNVSLSEFNDHRTPFPGKRRNFYDTMYQVFCARIFYYECHKYYEKTTIEHLHLYEIMLSEYKNTGRNVPLDVALSYYIEYLYLMTCLPLYARGKVDGLNLSVSSNSSFLPSIDKNIYELEKYKAYVNFDVIFSTNPPSFLTNDEFKSYIDDIFDSSFNFQKWDDKIRKRLLHYYEFF